MLRKNNCLGKVGRKVTGINILGKSTTSLISFSTKINKFRTVFLEKTLILLRKKVEKDFCLRKSSKF